MILANGAKDDTKRQMEKAFGISTESANRALQDFRLNLCTSGNGQLKIADSIWLRDDERLMIDRDFRKLISQYFCADIFKETFDNDILTKINSWVSSKTDNMIPEILDRISSLAMMYAINAVCFDAKWEKPYESYTIMDNILYYGTEDYSIHLSVYNYHNGNLVSEYISRPDNTEGWEINDEDWAASY